MSGWCKQCLWGGLLLAGTVTALAAESVVVPEGNFEHPVLLDRERRTEWVASFRVDARPVSREDYAAFVEAHPHWRRSAVAGLFHDGAYLRGWPSDASPDGAPEAPVVQVSWYAARAYCEAQGGTLPSLVQWEYLVDLRRRLNGLSDEDYANAVFAWYGEQRPAAFEDRALGLSGFIGPVNEWLEDYQLLLANGDRVDFGGGSCGDTGRLILRYDSAHYATLLRYQMRSNHAPETTASNLGFRCVYP